MLLYYVRHGDPIYDPNQLTPLGALQAAAAAKRLAVYGMDGVYSSPSNRAVQTAQALCDLLKKEMKLLPWADEALIFDEMSAVQDDGNRDWIWKHPRGRLQLNSSQLLALGREWYRHPDFAGTAFADGMERIQRETDSFLAVLGYRHDLENNCFYEEGEAPDRVALFAHEGVGAAILSCILDIPYPMFVNRFKMTHSGITVLNFEPRDGVVLPQILTYSNDAHLYREGLPTRSENRIAL